MRIIHEEPSPSSKILLGVLFTLEELSGENTTVDGERYTFMFNNCLLSKLNEFGLDNMWYQWDEATLFLALRLLERSTDLTAPDFFVRDLF